jgi:hypothetical protein
MLIGCEFRTRILNGSILEDRHGKIKKVVSSVGRNTRSNETDLPSLILGEQNNATSSLQRQPEYPSVS